MYDNKEKFNGQKLRKYHFTMKLSIFVEYL